ncbi:hypothetical protein POL68_05765 [Stigmatella sp. ncwal1]|uniref:WD40-like Beta Propeller Repeat n=1 Tax=Stigmatella ashevillensis TaxID=2995309 RepID=A0ABT5D6T9_9BACT|nr:hypothetical protein [Stigmatella ashevillena]MDC0707971.1 hypothetical protein [Stigmatella ashevillena]
MSTRCHWQGGWVFLACLLMASGCATVSPRFSQEVQASFVRDDMRKLTTRSLEMYYPEPLRPTALRIAARVEACVDRLRELTRSKRPRDKLLIYLTSAGFNNAYVVSDLASIPQQMVMPAHMSLELFNLMDLGGSELGDVGCHEAVHYVQMQQVEGFWYGVNLTTGGIFQPNIFTESWFLEGLATYYEGHFDRETGRPHSPIWHGWFDAVAQARGGNLNPGHLSPENREMDPFGGNYLTGSHFVAWLAKTYGEQKLWELVQEQGSSWFSPFGVTLRFRHVYGKTLGGLFDEFSASVKKELVVRERPASQALHVPDVGYFSRMASSPRDGASAVIQVGRTQTPHLTVYERDGRVRFSRRLTLLLPGRKWISSDPSSMSGLSFTQEGALLYLVAADIDSQGAYLSRLWRVDARTGEVLRTWDLQEGMGGGVIPDGTGYVFVDVKGDTANLARLNLESGQTEPLTRFEGHLSLGPPSVSPDGQRVAFPMRGPQGWDLALREPTGDVRWLTRDGLFNYSPHWVDDDLLLFLREHDGRLQAHTLRLSTGEIVRITDAPHLVMDAHPVGNGQVAFLNREGYSFTLDRAPLAPIDDAAPPVLAALLPVTPVPPAPPEAVAETPPAEAPPAEAAPSSDTPGVETPVSPPPVPSEEPPALLAAEAEPQATFALAEPPPAPGQDVHVLADRPYSSLEGLLVPELRIPVVLLYQEEDTEDLRISGLLSIAGQDRLGFHAYAFNAAFDSGTTTPSLTFSYGNALLAPWYLLTGVGYAQTEEDQEFRDETFTLRQKELQASMSLSRSFWTTPVALGFIGLRRRYEYVGVPSSSVLTTLFGPSFATAYFAGEGTSYGGTQRGLGLSLSGALYPKSFGSDVTMGDVRVEADAYLGGLPFLGRDNLLLSVAGRFLPGAPRELLEVGGLAVGNTLYRSRETDGQGPGIPWQYQPGLSFSEYLRGYEDYTITARHAVIGNAQYRYRVIIDHGWTSLLYLLPSLFISQFELEGFGAWARTDWKDNFRAAGGAARLRFTLGQTVPISVYYQYAHRFDAGRQPLHFVGLSF